MAADVAVVVVVGLALLISRGDALQTLNPQHGWRHITEAPSRKLDSNIGEVTG